MDILQKIKRRKDIAEEIVERIKRKKAKAIHSAPVKGSLAELRQQILAPKEVKIREIQTLRFQQKGIIAKIGELYLKFEDFFSPIASFIGKLAMNSRLNHYLDSAAMPFNAIQWIAITTVISIIVAIFMFIVATIHFAITFSNIQNLLIFPVVGFIITAILLLDYPKYKARRRAFEVLSELPYALRHMSILVKGGLGLYSSIKKIAYSNYGVLSEEFRRVVIEVEEGSDMKDALNSLAQRTESKELRNAIMHIIRALKVGGKLSEVLLDIAETITFELLQKTREFTQKLNFIGVIFIFLTIVVPTIFAILVTIANSPARQGFLALLQFDERFVILFYIILMPLVLITLFNIVKAMQPR